MKRLKLKIMNKYSYLLVSLLVFASCASDHNEPITTPAGAEISFSTYVNAPTRAASLDIDGLKTDGFLIYASQHAGAYANQSTSFMNGFQASYDAAGSAWDYTPHQYWPENGDKVSFFAYNTVSTAPDAIAYTDGDGTTAPSITVTVSKDCAAQQDVLVANPVLDQEYVTNVGKVDFTFKHIMSKVVFGIDASAISLSDQLKMKINKIDVVYGTGLVSKGAYNMITGWEAPLTDTYTPDDRTAVIANEHEVPATGSVDLYAGETAAHLMFVPQDYPADAIKVEVTYTLTMYKADGVTETDTQTRTVTESLPVVAGGWLPATAYTYNLKLQSFDVIEVGLGSITAWDGTPAEISVEN